MNKAYKILIILFTAQIFMAVGGMSISAISPFLMTDLSLSKTQIGFFVAAFFLGSSIIAFPSGILVDIVGEKKILIAGQTVLGISLIIFSFYYNYVLLLVLFFLMGLGYGTITPLSVKAIIEWFPLNRRGLMIGLKQTGATVGGALSAAVLPILAVTFGWRTAILLCGLLILLTAVISHFFYYQKENASKVEVKSNYARNYIELIKNRKIAFLSITTLFLSASQSSFVTYLVIYFTNELLNDVIVAGSLLMLVNLGGTVGRLTWGTVSDLLFRSNRIVVMVLITTITAVGMFLMSIVKTETSYIIIATLVTILGFCVIGWNALCLIMVGELVENKFVGTAIGINATFFFAGAIIGPPAFGALIDLTNSFSIAYQVYAVIGVLLALSYTLFGLKMRVRKIEQ